MGIGYNDSFEVEGSLGKRREDYVLLGFKGGGKVVVGFGGKVLFGYFFVSGERVGVGVVGWGFGFLGRGFGVEI